MLVSVIAVLSANDALRNSAAASAEGQMSLDVASTAAPESLQLDPTFPAIPIGNATSEGMMLEAMTPQGSQGFVVRGTVDIDPSDPPSTVDGVAIFADPPIDLTIVCPGDAPVGNAQDVATALDVPGLNAKGLTGQNVAIGVMDNGINLTFLSTALGWTPALDTGNSWNMPGSGGSAGGYPTDHGSMCAFDALIAAPNATLVDFAIMGPGGGRLSDALAAYSQVLSSWAISGSGGGLSQYNAVVLTNSWSIMNPAADFPPGSPGRYVDNPNHPLNLMVAAVVRAGVDVVFCAGNCGADCPDSRCGATSGSICGANALDMVLTIAGCDTTGARVGYSSQGPSIAGMYQEKPDVTAYTHFLGSQAFGAGSADSGTSAACPVAAGCVAAIRTLTARGIDSNTVFGALRANTGASGTAGWDADYGFGIVNPVAAATSLGL
ncbi:MAG: S8 family serine peptidase [Caulobacteraceae bacterium]|nr:S8 family serine peptidase [Caulobacteraceae bacterium]